MSKLYTSQRINIKARWGTAPELSAENPHGLYIKSNLKPLNIQKKRENNYIRYVGPSRQVVEKKTTEPEAEKINICV